MHAASSPVLSGQQLEVLEPDAPSAEERRAVESEEGIGAIASSSSELDGVVMMQGGGVWVRWHEAPDFHGSGPRDRHYVLDHLTGEVRFGDGLNGLIPPAGTGNVRLACYRTGGAAAGNVAAGTIVELKTTVPYVDSVTNTEPSGGGAEAEGVSSLLTRAPRGIRHRNRAVTVEDYEDLAMLASPEVQRVRCVPLRDLEADPDGVELRPGTVSLIIVPRSRDARPVPSLELIDRVRDHLDLHRSPVASLAVVGPNYVRVDVDTEVAVARLEGVGDLERAVRAALDRFLHPLTGGLSGSGWDWGRRPHRSDLYALIESVPGVRYVRSLAVLAVRERTGEQVPIDDPLRARVRDRFLVYSGTHVVRVRFEAEA